MRGEKGEQRGLPYGWPTAGNPSWQSATLDGAWMDPSVDCIPVPSLPTVRLSVDYFLGVSNGASSKLDQGVERTRHGRQGRSGSGDIMPGSPSGVE